MVFVVPVLLTLVLPAEFYQFFFENFKDYLYDSINYSFQNKILSTEQR